MINGMDVERNGRVLNVGNSSIFAWIYYKELGSWGPDRGFNPRTSYYKLHRYYYDAWHIYCLHRRAKCLANLILRISIFEIIPDERTAIMKPHVLQFISLNLLQLSLDL